MLFVLALTASPAVAHAVTQEAEPNDSRTSATGYLTSGQQATGNRSTAEDIDWFKFYVGERCDVTVGLEALGDSWTMLDYCEIQVRDKYGRQLHGGVWTNVTWIHRLPAGVYYVTTQNALMTPMREYGITVSGIDVTTVRPSTPKAPAKMRPTRSYTVYGTLNVKHDAGTYPVRIYKYRKVDRKWKSYGYVNAKASDLESRTKYSAKVKLSRRGSWRLRAHHVGTNNDQSWSSGYAYVSVK